MSKLTMNQLGDRLRRERGSRGIREVAGEIGISPATLSRVERGNVPDLETFARMCRWLKLDPAAILDVDVSALRQKNRQAGLIVASAHFRGGPTNNPELAGALAELILAAQQLLQDEASK